MTVMTTLSNVRSTRPPWQEWRRLLRAKNETPTSVQQFPLAEIIETNGLSMALFCIGGAIQADAYESMWRKYAVWCARRVEGHMCEMFRSALDVAWEYADGNAEYLELKNKYSELRRWVIPNGPKLSSADWAAFHTLAYQASCSAIHASASAIDAKVYAYAASHGIDFAYGEVFFAETSAHAEKLKKILNAGEWV